MSEANSKSPPPPDPKTKDWGSKDEKTCEKDRGGHKTTENEVSFFVTDQDMQSVTINPPVDDMMDTNLTLQLDEKFQAAKHDTAKDLKPWSVFNSDVLGNCPSQTQAIHLYSRMTVDFWVMEPCH